MLEYGKGQNNFAAMPKVVQGKPKYKDPYNSTGKIAE
jgi:hypothetical protein